MATTNNNNSQQEPQTQFLSDCNNEKCPVKLEVESPIMFKRFSYQIRLIVDYQWQEKSDVQPHAIVTAVLSGKWKKHGTLEDARCPHCCNEGEPTVDIDYAGSVREHDGASEVYTFTAKSRCTSSRAHLGCAIVFVVSDIPGLSPVVSVPVALQARFRRYRGPRAIERAKTKIANSLEVRTSNLSKQLSVNPATIDLDRTSNYRRPEIGVGSFLLQKAVDSMIAHRASGLPASTVATSSLLLSLATKMPPARVTRPIIMLGFVKTKRIQLLLDHIKPVVRTNSVTHVADELYVVMTLAASVEKGYALLLWTMRDNAFGYNLFLPNPFFQLVGWASNLFW